MKMPQTQRVHPMSYHNVLSNEMRISLEMATYFDEIGLLKVLDIKLGDNLQENIEIIQTSATIVNSFFGVLQLYEEEGMMPEKQYQPKRLTA